MTEELEHKSKVHPKKFSLWLLLLSILMLFAGLTSAYIVRQGDGNWFNFQMPPAFFYSTLVVLASSISLILAFRALKAGDKNKSILGLVVTIVLALGFVLSQYMGWKAMQGEGLYFVNPKFGDKVSASFLLAIAGIHLVHIFAGIIYLFSILFRVSRNKINLNNTLSFEMCNTYWHFVGILWVYLYLFLYFAPDF